MFLNPGYLLVVVSWSRSARDIMDATSLLMSASTGSRPDGCELHRGGVLYSFLFLPFQSLVIRHSIVAWAWSPSAFCLVHLMTREGILQTFKCGLCMYPSSLEWWEIGVALCKDSFTLFRCGEQQYTRASGHARVPCLVLTTEVE